jgi:filamentous hemagglutinin
METAPLNRENLGLETLDGGHEFALEVLDDGTGRGLTGHGGLLPETVPEVFTVPDGSSLSIWTRPNTGLPDSLGRLIESGDYDKIAKLFSENQEVQQLFTGATTNLPGARVPNYTLSKPEDLMIHRNSISVKDEVTLSNLIQPNAGHYDWAACTALQ